MVHGAHGLLAAIPNLLRIKVLMRIFVSWQPQQNWIWILYEMDKGNLWTAANAIFDAHILCACITPEAKFSEIYTKFCMKRTGWHNNKERDAAV